MNQNLSIKRCSILLLACGLLLQACTKASNPVSPTTSTVAFNPTPTPPISAGVSEINWYSASFSRTNEFSYSAQIVDVYFSVNGQAEASDTVILTGGSAPVTIPYDETVTIGGGVYARYNRGDGAFQYQPGTLYTLSTQTSVGTAWASIVAPGGIEYSTNGGSVDWVSEGTNDRVYVETSGFAGTYDSLNTTADVNSAFTIPLSAFPSTGTYYIRATCETVVGTVNNAMAGSSLQASDELWDSASR